MNGEIRSYSFTESFIDRLAEEIITDFGAGANDFRRLTVVFGGKRPALFLNRALAKRIKKSFYPPKIYSIDEFISLTLRKRGPARNINDLDACYLLFQLALEKTPEVLAGRNSFAEFLPWGWEILRFIDHLDLEDVPAAALEKIKASAQIGYDVPEDINRLLRSIVTLRGLLHARLKENRQFTRGLQYLLCSELIAEIPFDEADQVLFCNFFYFHRCEEKLVRNLYDRKKASLIFQGDVRKWPVFERIEKQFSCRISEGPQLKQPAFHMDFYAAFDIHSQVGFVSEIIKKVKAPEQCVIVLPNPESMMPLLSQISHCVEEFNISMGYPLKRSSLYALFSFVFRAQLSRKKGKYYAKDYLAVLRHPFIKNLKVVSGDGVITRTLIHKLEEVLTGKEPGDISGHVFLGLETIEESRDIFVLAEQMLRQLGQDVSQEDLKSALRALHHHAFFLWEHVQNFSELASALEEFLDELIKKSSMHQYPLNVNIAQEMLKLYEEFKEASFKDEAFPQEELFKIFDSKVSQQMISFKGSPLKGLQVLGLFETRSLNFEDVIVIDANEGILPSLNVYEPLIPREVMISLGLNRLELEEEIQRYQFMRLISSARRVHVIYREGDEKERSRFVEELIWEEEKKAKHSGLVPVTYASYESKLAHPVKTAAKTKEMVDFLKGMKYSASSLNTYLRNPMEFYTKYVLGLEEKEDLLDEPEARQLGTFIHEVLEMSFKIFLNKKPVIDAAFRRRFQKILDDHFEHTLAKTMKTDSFLMRAVIDERLKRFLDHEESSPGRKVSKVLYLERAFEDTLTLPSGNLALKYIVDRVDQMDDGTIMIVDYKTGSVNQMPGSLESILQLELSRESIKDKVRSFQIPLYFFYLKKQFPEALINAGLYNLRTVEMKTFLKDARGADHAKISDAFLKPLDFIVSEILDPQVDFVEDLDRGQRPNYS